MYNPHYEPGDSNGEVEPATWESTLDQLDAHHERVDGIDFSLRQACGGGYRKAKLDGEGSAKDPPVTWKRKRRKPAVSLTKADLISKYRKLLAQRYGVKGKRQSVAEGADPSNPASWTADHEMPISVHDEVVIGLVRGFLDDLSSMKETTKEGYDTSTS